MGTTFKPASQNPVLLTKEQQIDMWSDLFAFWNFYPDLFLDAVRPKDPETGELMGISLDFAQRMFLRSIFRFEQTYHCYSRGFGKTLVELLATYTRAVLTPNYTQFMTAQSLKKASELFKQKHAEIIKFFPFFKNEFAKEPIIKEGKVEIPFKNGSFIGILPNTDDAKGSRGNNIVGEESALMDKSVFDDAIEPIVSEPYPNQRIMSCRNPYILNGLHFVTTTYFASMDAFQHNKTVVEDMIALQGRMAFGASYRLPVAFGRGRRMEEYITIKASVSPLSWLTNYEQRWVGGAQRCLVPVNVLLESRKVEEPELECDGVHEYYMGVDVARSQNDNQCATSVSVIKVYRDEDKIINKIQVVYLTNIEGTLDFEGQTLIIKKLYYKFKPKAIVIDANGLGVGLVDMTKKRTVDSVDGRVYPAFDHVNWKESYCSDPSAIKCVYPIKAQGINDKIVTNFMVSMNSMVELLAEKDVNVTHLTKDIFNCKELCYVHTDMLVEEINNLQTVETGVSKKLSVESISKKFNKDRYSSLAYVLYYVKTEDNVGEYGKEEEKVNDELFRMLQGTISMPRIR